MPLVSVLLSVHNDAEFLGAAVQSVLRQTVDDLELIVVDDASTDATPEILSSLADLRLTVLTNEEQRGLAASLNRAFEQASGKYAARLDADDIAAPQRLELQLARIRHDSRVAALGSAIVDLDGEGREGRVHMLPQGLTAVRWHALFSSPFFHPTVMVDREALEAHGLRYDPSFLESEDYDLWTRLFAFADGDNLAEPLVLKRVHPAQASRRRGALQESFQRQVALREIALTAPHLDTEAAELAWRLGSGKGVSAMAREQAGEALLELLAAFERKRGVDPAVRHATARSLGRAGLLKSALKLSPLLPARLVAERVARRSSRRLAMHPVRATVISPEPTPYRAPLFDRIAARGDIDLTVVYAARTVARRAWSVEQQHRSHVLKGLRLPGLRRALRHDYPVTPGVGRALGRSRPDVVVVSGWSTFASQAALGWCRARRVPYVLLVESHDLEPRAFWRRTLKRAVVPRLLRGAASVLVVGTAARDSVTNLGAAPELVRVFANTIDVERWIERAQDFPAREDGGRTVVLSVGRLVREKGFDVLANACAEAGVELVLAGDGPERERLQQSASVLGHLTEDELARRYAEADVFALLSRHEPWGVVVNEAAASGLPLVLSDRVGAAHDLLRVGENGFLVPADDVEATAAALKKLSDDSELRRKMGARSRALVRGWGYEPSVESFVAAVREATSR